MRIQSFCFILLTAALFGACKKDYLSVNEVNPNQTQSPPINGLLAAVTYQTGINYFRAGDFTSYYVQYLASPNVGGPSDIYENADRSSFWFNTSITGTNPFGGVYNTVMDGRVLLQQARAANAYEHMGVVRVTEAMNMSLMIDLFGDVPYSEAFNPAIFTPKYDKAEDIFNSCLVLLDSAIVDFQKQNPPIKLDAASDLIHAASVPRWIKTAHAIKARLLNRLSKLPTYNPTAILAEVGLAYANNNEDAQVTKFVTRNPWGQVAQNNAQNLLDGWMSEQFIDALNGTSFGVVDPRLKLIATTTAAGTYKGTPNGKGRTGSGTTRDESYLSVTGFYSKPDAPLLLATYAEMKFIEAEASFATDRARSYRAYLAGIEAHMDKLGVPAGEKTAYLSNPAVAVGEANLTRALIFKEKYVAMFLHPESWTDARRFDYAYKDFTLPNGALLPTYIRRAGYPSSELSRNAGNVPNITALSERLWWDK
ncbi:SusD/RagB family nutrient-binding outer membrane lipoprotein [Segetibacter sp. 3557_3]|uniref:SusD/RagB family nutrient-binding outer membrane lipoprotein n=1 Tax=Segetibacter sp. 3557_3 TaxID=2547429 RepID=UPI0010586778|nr:SusD/RagB family nutrient-binding outer membrane lipoprotein [Segetibacter sp. 3557_3]TDH21391.1 SusD/RagB family nutrient-binding outer membrane lipoprotein [Segetibacter sp. 3557_3]